MFINIRVLFSLSWVAVYVPNFSICCRMIVTWCRGPRLIYREKDFCAALNERTIAKHRRKSWMQCGTAHKTALIVPATEWEETATKDWQASHRIGASCWFAKNSSLSKMWLALAKRSQDQNSGSMLIIELNNSQGNITGCEIVTLLNRC